MKAMLAGMSRPDIDGEADLSAFLHRVSGLDTIVDPSTREALRDALGWACDLLRDGLSPEEIRVRIRIGDESSLLSEPGVHLLTGHSGKGQQFDWVVILGAEEGSIPDFRAETQEQREEEARVLSVMISRARHGVFLMSARVVEGQDGRPWPKAPSSFLEAFESIEACRDLDGIRRWIHGANWNQLSRLKSP